MISPEEIAAHRSRLDGEIPSPCVSICRINPETSHCDGCLRTIDEIKAWRSLDNHQRLKLLAVLDTRRSVEMPMNPRAPQLPNELSNPLIDSAINWFAQLRDLLCARFEEQERLFAPLPDSLASQNLPPCGKFDFQPWQRFEEASFHNGDSASDPPKEKIAGGGGVMGIMRGRVFAKVGVNISTVYGKFSPEFAKQVPGAEDNPQFLACGISVVAHPRSPKIPIAHLNTRFVRTSRGWFGGGGDLTPVFPIDSDTDAFHQAFKNACDKFNPEYYPNYKKWCDDYFYIKHRGEARGVGGIFYDYLATGDENCDFEFTKAVGRAFLDIYPKIVARHRDEDWTMEDVEKQLEKRARYVEFNLIYDRGTAFGLKTGGNIEAILMSMPPLAAWR